MVLKPSGKFKLGIALIFKTTNTGFQFDSQKHIPGNKDSLINIYKGFEELSIERRSRRKVTITSYIHADPCLFHNGKSMTSSPISITVQEEPLRQRFNQ